MEKSARFSMMLQIMRTPPLLLALVAQAMAGDIIVVTPSNDLAVTTVESLATGEALNNPEPTPMQESLLKNYTFKQVEPGKYRVSYLACENPLSFHETLMETLVTVGEGGSNIVYLFRPRDHGQLKIPKSIENFLRLNHDKLMELTAIYDGAKTQFVQARGGAWAIRYLRNDCEYRLKVWNHSFRDIPKDPKERAVIFERTFRAVDREPEPFSPSGIPREPTQQTEAAPFIGVKPRN
jgi:hypothetical protein